MLAISRTALWRRKGIATAKIHVLISELVVNRTVRGGDGDSYYYWWGKRSGELDAGAKAGMLGGRGVA